jgi:membrane protease YdiL (CAAX protease family)
MQDPIYSKIEATPRPTLFAASGFVLLAAVGLWVSSLLELLLPNASMALINALYYIPFTVLPVGLYMLRRPGLETGMRLNAPPLLPTLSAALLGVLSVYVASLLSAAWAAGLDALGLRGLGGVPTPGNEGELMLSVLSLAALPAVCEELLFRGFVLSAWESRGTRYAIGVTALLFALLHGNLYGIPAYLLVGAVAGFLAFALDSAYAAMVYHTVYNTACLVIPYLASGLEGKEGAAVTFDAAAIFSLAVQAAMIAALMAMTMMTLRLRAQRTGIVAIPRIRRPVEGRDRLMLLAAVAVMVASMAILLVLTVQGGVA